MPKLRKLASFEEFERMRVFTRPLTIFQDGEQLDTEVIIHSHDEHEIISTKNERYLKETCEFYYGSK